MENATKGLMIAGAILIAIVLIGLGVWLVSQTDVFKNQASSTLDEAAVTAFNSSIEQYEGKQSGSNIKALLTKLNTMNLGATRDGVFAEQCIGISVSSATDKNLKDPDFTEHTEYTDAFSKAVVAARSRINSGKSYTVVIDYDGATKLVSKVTITDYVKD